MLLIECPYCGVRAETEFAYGGEGGIARPLQTETLSDEQWGDYLFMRKTPKGCTTNNGAMPVVVAAGSMRCATR
jgi:heterotetrameric sarcosine oxidase delta subunit